jgi:hypothetical protein
MLLPALSKLRPWRVLSLVAGLLGASTEAMASAPQTPSVEPAAPLVLEWKSHAPGCDAENVVQLTLSSLAPSARPRHIAATAQVHREGDDWVVQLDTRSSMHTGRRILRSPSCSDLRQALALLLAMILESEQDPDSVELPIEAAGGASEELRPGADRPPEKGEKERLLLVIAQAGGSYGTGLQPGTSWGVGGGAGVAWRFLEASVRFTHWPTTRTSVPQSTGHVQVSRSDVALALCASFDALDWLSVVPCLAPALTLFDSHAENTSNPTENKSQTLFAFGGTLDVRYWLPGQHIFVSLAPGVVWEKRQPFVIRRTCEDGAPQECVPGNDVIDNNRGVGASLSLALGARF